MGTSDSRAIAGGGRLRQIAAACLAALALSSCTVVSDVPPTENGADAPSSTAEATSGSSRGASGGRAPFEIRPDETLREHRSASGEASFSWDMDEITPVFATYVMCAPGVTLELSITDSTSGTEAIPVVCDNVISRETTVHDPAQLVIERLDVRVTGEGQWAVALAESSAEL